MKRWQFMYFVFTLAGFLSLQASAAGEEDGQWYPSRYGAADTIGAANNLSPEKTLLATRLVKQGKAVSLAIDTGADTPAPPFRSYQMHIMHPGDGTGAPGGPLQATSNDDMMITWLGIGTQIDGTGSRGHQPPLLQRRPCKGFCPPLRPGQIRHTRDTADSYAWCATGSGCVPRP